MINQKYELLNEGMRALREKVFNLLVAYGEHGMGKSHTIIAYAEEHKLNYAYIHSYVTPMKFYELLYENRDKDIIIFDDTESIDDRKIISMLKSACWSVVNNDRKVSYNTTDKYLEDNGIPSEFVLNANIALIFNDKFEGFAPVVGRGLCIDFDFSFEDKMQIFREMSKERGREMGDGTDLDEEIISYVSESCDKSTDNVNIRSLVILSRLKAKGFDWKKFAQEVLGSDNLKSELIKCLSQHEKVENACEEWCNKCNRSRRTFFNLKKEMGL